jgi:hypothetical protein
MQMIQYDQECEIRGATNLAVSNANTQIALTQTNIDKIVKNKIKIMNDKFNTYLSNLYGNVCQ